jgi:hypothetical protein
MSYLKDMLNRFDKWAGPIDEDGYLEKPLRTGVIALGSGAFGILLSFCVLFPAGQWVGSQFSHHGSENESSGQAARGGSISDLMLGSATGERRGLGNDNFWDSYCEFLGAPASCLDPKPAKVYPPPVHTADYYLQQFKVRISTTDSLQVAHDVFWDELCVAGHDLISDESIVDLNDPGYAVAGQYGWDALNYVKTRIADHQFGNVTQGEFSGMLITHVVQIFYENVGMCP